MVRYHCKTCDYTWGNAASSFCPNCSSNAVEEITRETQPPHNPCCPGCGAPVVAIDSRFCSKCGTSLTASPAVMPAQQEGLQQANLHGEESTTHVIGRVIAKMPLARMLEKPRPKGFIALHEDGIFFRYRYIVKKILVYEEWAWDYREFRFGIVTHASVGKRPNILQLQRNDQVLGRFKIIGAKKWVDIINQQIQTIIGTLPVAALAPSQHVRTLNCIGGLCVDSKWINGSFVLTPDSIKFSSRNREEVIPMKDIETIVDGDKKQEMVLNIVGGSKVLIRTGSKDRFADFITSCKCALGNN